MSCFGTKLLGPIFLLLVHLMSGGKATKKSAHSGASWRTYAMQPPWGALWRTSLASCTPLVKLRRAPSQCCRLSCLNWDTHLELRRWSWMCGTPLKEAGCAVERHETDPLTSQGYKLLWLQNHTKSSTAKRASLRLTQSQTNYRITAAALPF